MKNKVILAFLIIIFGISIINEPVDDTIDIISGATNDTYGTNSDAISGASTTYKDDDDDDDDDDHEDEEEDEDEEDDG